MGPKVTFVGGGSAKFVSGLVRDLYAHPDLAGAEIRLMDIDAARLDRSLRLVRRVLRAKDLPEDRVAAFTDRRAAVAGADFVVVTVMVGGFAHYESDGAIPCRHGVFPTVGDTIGPGAVFRLVRTGPVLEGLARDVAETAPGAWILNYTNPMAMCTWTLLDHGARAVGLCHSIQGSYRQLAGFLGVPEEEVEYTAGGLNHVDFYLTLTRRGRDLYPDLLAKKDEILAKHPALRVKFELLEHLGGWPAEGEHHQTEYYPWFRKTRQMGEERYATETMWGYHFDRRVNGELDQIVEDQIAGRRPLDFGVSLEYGARIVHAWHADRPLLVYGNVRNGGLVSNLPAEAVVEVPCLADRQGIRPCRVGELPRALAGVMAPHATVHGLATEALRRRDLRLLRQAVQADPMTAAVLTLPQIQAMFDELRAANADYLQDWK